MRGALTLERGARLRTTSLRLVFLVLRLPLRLGLVGRFLASSSSSSLGSGLCSSGGLCLGYSSSGRRSGRSGVLEGFPGEHEGRVQGPLRLEQSPGTWHEGVLRVRLLMANIMRLSVVHVSPRCRAVLAGRWTGSACSSRQVAPRSCLQSPGRCSHRGVRIVHSILIAFGRGRWNVPQSCDNTGSRPDPTPSSRDGAVGCA